MRVDPIFRIRNASRIVDILGPNSGWMVEDPYWQPQIAQYKGGGNKVNSSIAPGQRLVHKEYDNVIETIPLVLKGNSQQAAIQTLDELMLLAKETSDYWTESYQLDDAWIECQLPCEDALTGYAQAYQFSIPELKNPFGQPFFSMFNEAVMNGITLTLEREPLWRGVQPGSIIGPLYNMLKNPDFEFWNFGTLDSQPDSWTDLETIQITGQNSQHSTAVHSGQYALKVRVSGSTLTGRFKGVTQVIANTRANTQYTIVAWVRSEGVSNGVGRILVTYASQLELYRSAARHGWTVYANTFTTGPSDVVAVNLEILTTGANCDGTVYFDSLMLLEGDWVEEAERGILPYISSSHLTNRNDQPGASVTAGGAVNPFGALNYVDVWDIPGNDDADVRVEMLNNNTPENPAAITEVIATIRASMRRAGDITLFKNFYDPFSVAETSNASGYNAIRLDTFVSTQWTTIAAYLIDDDDVISNMTGRYRLFVRLQDSANPSNLKIRAQYWIGSNDINVKTLEAVTIPVGNSVWCIVNLTLNAAINWDFKFDADAPGRLGLAIQMQRVSGTGNIRLDYAHLMPSDGGMMITDLNPTILPQSALVIDELGTASGLNKRVGWREVFRLATVSSNFQYLKNFNGALFTSTLTAPNPGRIYKYQNGLGTLVFTGQGASNMPLEVYNGRLHFADRGVATTLYASDGSSFPTATIGTFAGNPVVYVLKAIGNRLYAGLNNGTAEYWTGIGGLGSIAINTGGGGGNFRVIEGYGDKVYFGGDQLTGSSLTAIYEHNPITFTNTLSKSFGATSATRLLFALRSFKGRLYAGLGDATGGGQIWSFDGTTWAISYTHPTASASTKCTAFTVFNDTLFATVYDNVTAKTLIVQTEDGVTWTNFYAPFSNVFPLALEASEGQIFMSSGSNFLAYSSIYAVALKSIKYKVSDYQLSKFSSPPKKRHRFFFSWDRANSVNNADDKALCGLGFIPRYRTLRGSK